MIRNPTPGYIPTGNEIIISERCPQSRTHCSIIHCNQHVKTAQVPIDRRKEEEKQYICIEWNIMQPQKENATICDNVYEPKDIMLSDITQLQKDKHYTISLKHGV